MKTSESITEINKALVGFHNDIKQPLKDKANPFFKSKYVPLENIAEVIDEAVREVGLEIDYRKVGVSGQVRAYSALEQVYKKEGKERLQKVLLFIRRNLGVGRKELSGWYIKGINAFLNEFQNHPNFDIDWLEKRVVSEGFQVIDHNVRAMQSMFKKGYEQSVVAVLKETYNKGKAYENRI